MTSDEHIERIIDDIIGLKPSENTEGVWSLAVWESKAEKIRTALTSAYNMGLEKAKEEIVEARTYDNWNHTKGSHSDDPQDREPCDCTSFEIRAKNDAYDAMINRLAAIEKEKIESSIE